MDQKEQFLKEFEEKKVEVTKTLEERFPGKQKNPYFDSFTFLEMSMVELDLERDRNRYTLLSGDLYLRVQSSLTLLGTRYNHKWKYTPKNLEVVFQKITQLLNEEQVVNTKLEEGKKERIALRNLQKFELENENIHPATTLRRTDSGKYYLDIRSSLISLQAALAINDILNRERQNGE